MEPNTDGALCKWCGEEVEKVSKPEYPGDRPMGKCENDGIVYVVTDPEKVNA